MGAEDPFCRGHGGKLRIATATFHEPGTRSALRLTSASTQRQNTDPPARCERGRGSERSGRCQNAADFDPHDPAVKETVECARRRACCSDRRPGSSWRNACASTAHSGAHPFSGRWQLSTDRTGCLVPAWLASLRRAARPVVRILAGGVVEGLSLAVSVFDQLGEISVGRVEQHDRGRHGRVGARGAVGHAILDVTRAFARGVRPRPVPAQTGDDVSGVSRDVDLRRASSAVGPGDQDRQWRRDERDRPRSDAEPPATSVTFAITFKVSAPYLARSAASSD